MLRIPSLQSSAEKECFRFCPRHMTETLASLEEFSINTIKEVHNEVQKCSLK
jgi:hypothetical protein